MRRAVRTLRWCVETCCLPRSKTASAPGDWLSRLMAGLCPYRRFVGVLSRALLAGLPAHLSPTPSASQSSLHQLTCEPRSERRGTAAFRRYGLVSGIDQVTIVVGYTPAATTAGADTIEKIGSEAVKQRYVATSLGRNNCCAISSARRRPITRPWCCALRARVSNTIQTAVGHGVSLAT